MFNVFRNPANESVQVIKLVDETESGLKHAIRTKVIYKYLKVSDLANDRMFKGNRGISLKKDPGYIFIYVSVMLKLRFIYMLLLKVI